MSLVVFFLSFGTIKADGNGNDNKNHQNHHGNHATSNERMALETGWTASNRSIVQVYLPTLEVQYVCHDGADDSTRLAPPAREDFNATDVFADLYRTLLPDMATESPTLQLFEKIGTMDDIPDSLQTKIQRGHRPCNATASDVLLTLRAKGFASFDRSSPDIVRLDEAINHNTIHTYFQSKVCSKMSNFRAVVESPFHKGGMSSKFQHVHHKILLLCGNYDEDWMKYLYHDHNGDDDDDGDVPHAGFLLIALLVGFIMVRMVVYELRQYGGSHLHDDGDGDDEDYAYEGIPREEVEMI